MIHVTVIPAKGEREKKRDRNTFLHSRASTGQGNGKWDRLFLVELFPLLVFGILRLLPLAFLLVVATEGVSVLC
jgi:hypothetical protein